MTCRPAGSGRWQVAATRTCVPSTNTGRTSSVCLFSRPQ